MGIRDSSVSAKLYRDARLLDVACASGAAAGLSARSRVVAAWAPRDLWLDLETSIPRLELATLLAASGLDLPATEGDLGSAALEARVTGRMLDPKSFVVEERLDFHPPSRSLPALEQFRGLAAQIRSGLPAANAQTAQDRDVNRVGHTGAKYAIFNFVGFWSDSRRGVTRR